MKECPRCHKMTLNDKQVLNALSRRGNEIYICKDCGTQETLMAARCLEPDEIERDFMAAVTKQTR